MGLKRKNLMTDEDVEDFRQAEIDDVIALICEKIRIRYKHLEGTHATEPIADIVTDMRRFIRNLLLMYGIERDRDITVSYGYGRIDVTPKKLDRKPIQIAADFGGDI